MSDGFRFLPLKSPVTWTGRYNRIPGKTSVFKARLDGIGFAYWESWKDNEWLTSYFIDSPATQSLIQAVNAAKRERCGSGGGAFQINEYGQVIVPIQGTQEKVLVGKVDGVPFFDDPRVPGRSFTLNEDDGLENGSLWDRPYIGMPFVLRAENKIVFKSVCEGGTYPVVLKAPAKTLVGSLRALRPYDGIRFLVNLHGLVLTKLPPDNRPVFVGKIDFEQWYPCENQETSNGHI